MPRGIRGSRSVNKHGSELYAHIAPRGALRAFTYRRKSKNAKEDDVSLDEQLTACLGRIESRNWVHVGDAWDLGAEGVDPDRPGYQQMLEWGRDDRFDVLVVWRSDRPFRGVAAAGPLAMLLYETSNRIALESVTDHFDANYLGINAFVGDTERQAIRRRTMDTRLNYARRGQLMAGALPYWIKRDERNHGELVHERAAIIIELIRRYVAGEPTRELARWMRLAAPERDDYKVAATWSASRIVKVLRDRNGALIGQLRYSAIRYTRRRDPETGVKVRHQEWKDDAEVVTIPIPPLLHADAAAKAACDGCEMDDRPTRADVHAAMGRRRSTGAPGGAGRPAIHRHPLRTRVFCAVCQGQMTMEARTHYIARTGERRPFPEPHLYLRCARSNGIGPDGERHMDAGTHRCRKPAMVRVDDVYGRVLEQLQRADLPDAIERAAETYTARAAQASRTPAMLADELQLMHQRFKDLTAEEVDLYKYKSTLSAGAFTILQQELLVKQEGIEQRIAELERAIEDAEQDRRLYDVIGAAELATRLRSVPWAALDDEDWIELVPALVYRVVVGAENKVMVLLALNGSPNLAIEVSNWSDTAITKLVA